MDSYRNIPTRLELAVVEAKRLGVFRTRDFVSVGFSREYLRRLLVSGQVRQLGRGLYSTESFEGDNNQTLVEVSKRFPRGVVCLYTALRFHGIGTQSPFEVWLALPRGTNFPVEVNLPVRFCKYSGAAYTFGIEEHKAAGGIVRVYSAAKTVADCFKYRNKYGIDAAVEALRDGWKQKKFTAGDISAAAKVCRVERIMQPYLEMIE